jgi:hypothetical protein
MGLSLTIAAGPRQRSDSQVRVPWDSWPHFTISDSRLPKPGEPGPRIYIPQEQHGDPVIPSGNKFHFHRLLWLAGLRWGIESESYVTTDGQSASLSWYKPPIRGLRPDFISVRNMEYVWQLRSWFRGTPSLTRGRVCHLSVIVDSKSLLIYTNMYKFTIFLMLFTIYTRPLSVQAQYSKLCTFSACIR